MSETVTLINPFTVPAGESERFLEQWKATARFMAAQPGFVSGRMHRALTDDAQYRFVNVAQWESRAALEQATSSPEFRSSTQRMLADPDLHVTAQPAVYEVVVDLPGNAR